MEVIDDFDHGAIIGLEVNELVLNAPVSRPFPVFPVGFF